MEKLAELLKDEAVAKEFFSQPTAEDAQKFLASKGVEVTLDELNELRQAMVSEVDSDELSDDQLDNVAGGVNWKKVAVVAACPSVFIAAGGAKAIAKFMKKW